MHQIIIKYMKIRILISHRNSLLLSFTLPVSAYQNFSPPRPLDPILCFIFTPQESSTGSKSSLILLAEDRIGN